MIELSNKIELLLKWNRRRVSFHSNDQFTQHGVGTTWITACDWKCHKNGWNNYWENFDDRNSKGKWVKKSLQLKCRVQLIVTINYIMFASGVYLLGFYMFAMK